MICPYCGDSFKPANSDYRPYCSESCEREGPVETADELEVLREQVERLDMEREQALALAAVRQDLLKPFAVVTEVWCVTCDPYMHAESIALFQDELRARQFCANIHGSEGRVEKRMITGRLGK